jgi:hypothetical protein
MRFSVWVENRDMIARGYKRMASIKYGPHAGKPGWYHPGTRQVVPDEEVEPYEDGAERELPQKGPEASMDDRLVLKGFVCCSAGSMDPQGVMGNCGDIELDPKDVVAFGLLKVYGKSGLFTLVRTSDGKTVKIILARQNKTSQKWIKDRRKGMRKPSYPNEGFTSTAWKDISTAES